MKNRHGSTLNHLREINKYCNFAIDLPGTNICSSDQQKVAVIASIPVS